MYGSPYGSYSGMSAAMDIAPSHNSRPQDASCAFPSWPQRESLSDNHCERATSYLSDEDLFPSDWESDYHSDARSVSSANSSSSSTPQQQYQPYQPEAVSERDVLEMQRERAAYQREVMRFLAMEKERRRSQAARKSKSSRSGSSSSKKGSPKSKLAAMTPIAEAE
jgi:hypothetical protein